MPEQIQRSDKLIAQFMRLFFRLLYHPFAWSYDLVAATVSLGRWNQWVQAAMRLVNGPRVLELGYGPGHLQKLLNENGLQIYGLDESWQMARQAHRNLVRRGNPSRLARGLAQRLPYPDNTFNTVIATFPTLYIVHPETMQEIQRVLKPGGRLVVLWAAWITGKSLPERFMQAVFRVTQESPEENGDLSKFIDPYTNAGFQASLRFVELRGSRLMFIVASKR